MILFHILDEAEAYFPFDGMVEFEEPESHAQLAIDADGFREDYLKEVEAFRETYRRECFQSGIDYVAAGHEHAVRQGPDRVPGPAVGEGVSLGIRDWGLGIRGRRTEIHSDQHVRSMICNNPRLRPPNPNP